MKNKTVSENELFFFKVPGFFDWIKTKKGREYSESRTEDATVESYRDALTIFKRFILEKTDYRIMTFRFTDCTRDLLLDYKEYLQKSGRAPRTINHRLAAIKAYLWFVADDDLAVQSVAIMASNISGVDEPKGVRERLTEEDLLLLFSAPKNNKIGIRDQTIMILLYDSAIRVSELTDLNVGNIGKADDGYYVRIRGKGNKQRDVGITQKTAEHLERYNSIYNPDANRDDPLFYAVRKEIKTRMSTGNVERIIKKYADLVREISSTIPDSVYPHMLRRTRSTNMYQNGVPLDLISRTLGHSQIETTRKSYAVPSQKTLREAQSSTGLNVEVPEWITEDDDKIAKRLGLR